MKPSRQWRHTRWNGRKFTTSAILHGSPNEVNVFVKITNIAIMASLLYLGGFWA